MGGKGNPHQSSQVSSRAGIGGWVSNFTPSSIDQRDDAHDTVLTVYSSPF